MKNAGFYSLAGVILLSVLLILSGFNNVNAETKLLALDGAANDWFGNSVAISGDTAVIGAVSDNDKGLNSGSAYVFVRDPATDNWIEHPKLLALDGEADDSFGISVAISDDTAIIGAHRDDDKRDGSGSAYIFVRDPATGSWSQRVKLTASDGAADDSFGGSVDIPAAAPANYGDNFGFSVAISGDTAVIGALLDDDNGSNSGSAYIFVRDPTTGLWTEQPKLLASDGAAGDKFGISVAISGDTAVIGSESGSAYVFVRDPDTDNWIEQAKLLASDGAAYDYFGGSVTIRGNTAIIGASGDDDKGDGSGSAYIFVRDPATGSWSQRVKLIASDGAASDSFGSSVAISGNTTIIGTRQDDDNGDSSGSAYVYRLPDISVSPTSHDFGSVDVGSTSLTHTFTVTNMGGEDLIIGTLGITGADASEFSIQNDNCSAQTIVASGTCTVGIVFSPASEGIKSATLTIPSNDPDTPTLDVLLSGVGGSCVYSISPANQFFISDGGTGSVSVTSAGGCDWPASSNASWINITSGSTGSGNGTVNYSVSPNTSTSSRTGTMTIAGKVFTVTQAGVGATPTPDIEANATDVSVTLTPTDNLSVTVTLNPGNSLGENADWWLAAKVSDTSTIDGWYYFDLSTFRFVPVGDSPFNLIVTHQGTLFDLTTYQILNNIPVSVLPPGTYTFYFAVDMNMNGILDFVELFFDSVVVVITP